MKIKHCQMQRLLDEKWLKLEFPEEAICCKRAIGTMKIKCIEHKESITERFYLCTEHYDDLSSEGEGEDREMNESQLIGFGSKQFILISKKGDCNFRVTYKKRLT